MSSDKAFFWLPILVLCAWLFCCPAPSRRRVPSRSRSPRSGVGYLLGIRHRRQTVQLRLKNLKNALQAHLNIVKEITAEKGGKDQDKKT